MSMIFFIVLGLLLLLMPIYSLSLEHEKLERRYGKERGEKIGAFLGRLSGWGFFFLLAGVWFSPQPSLLPAFASKPTGISLLYFKTTIANILISLPFIGASCIFGIRGVTAISLKTAETHKAEKLVTSGLYARMRHPQYFAALLAHLGFSILLSAIYSLLSFPLICVVVYYMAKKEEAELIKEFGKEYADYIEKVPMYLPLKKP